MQMVCPNGTVALVGCKNGTLFYPEKEPSGLDTFTVAGSANEELTTHFVYHGYQFVLLTGWPVTATPPTLHTLSVSIEYWAWAPSTNKLISVGLLVLVCQCFVAQGHVRTAVQVRQVEQVRREPQ